MSQPQLAGLSPVQLRIALSLASGATIASAASATGISRTTIYQWLENQPNFRAALEKFKVEYVLSIRDHMRDLASKALVTLKSLLDDPAVPASVRLKAALAVLDRNPPLPVTTFPVTPPEDHHDPDTEARTEPDVLEHIFENPVAPDPLPRNEAVRSPAVFTKVGRNEPCPCGSTRKYKRCCINNAPVCPTEPALIFQREELV